MMIMWKYIFSIPLLLYVALFWRGITFLGLKGEFWIFYIDPVTIRSIKRQISTFWLRQIGHNLFGFSLKGFIAQELVGWKRHEYPFNFLYFNLSYVQRGFENSKVKIKLGVETLSLNIKLQLKWGGDHKENAKPSAPILRVTWDLNVTVSPLFSGERGMIKRRRSSSIMNT